jgi:hypothetical protein
MGKKAKISSKSKKVLKIDRERGKILSERVAPG